VGVKIRHFFWAGGPGGGVGCEDVKIRQGKY
jgi:hypothetical protein